MNFVDFLFEGKKDLNQTLIINSYKQYTYAEIFSEILKISSYLNITYGKDNEILLLADNSPFFIISYFGIIKSGNIAIVLDTKNSHDDIKTIIKWCSPVACFFEDRYKKNCPDTICCKSEKDLISLLFSKNRYY